MIHIIVVCEPAFQTLWSHQKIKAKTVYHRWSEYQCRICNIRPLHWHHYINCIKCIHTVCIAVVVVVIIIPYNIPITWCYIPEALRAALVNFGFVFIVVCFVCIFFCEWPFLEIIFFSFSVLKNIISLIFLLFICLKITNQKKNVISVYSIDSFCYCLFFFFFILFVCLFV